MKVAANSLLYAVYICLIVSILCGALLTFANLYNQLNLFYNTREDLYIRNQSDLNFALANMEDGGFEAESDSLGIASSGTIRYYGLLPLLRLSTFTARDTVTSAYLAGNTDKNNFCLYMSDFSKPLTYAGNVRLIGDKKLPSPQIGHEYLNNLNGLLVSTGNIMQSETGLKDVNPRFKEIYDAPKTKGIPLEQIREGNDTLIYNSFIKETVTITIGNSILDHIDIEGNFIIQGGDSIAIGKGAHLKDVIIKADKVTVEEGFTGSLQIFARQKLYIGTNVHLEYPSAICLYSANSEETKMEVGEGSEIYGAVVLFGNSITEIDRNEVVLKEKSRVIGDIYCSGKLMPAGKVYGSVYANRIFYKTGSSVIQNCIINAEIDASRRPEFFISIPVFKENNSSYGVYKKVF